MAQLVAKEMEFVQGRNSPSPTSPLFVILQIFLIIDD